MKRSSINAIVDAARSQVETRGDFSLRGIAHALGMTAPALYRYVASARALSELVAADIEESVLLRIDAAVTCPHLGTPAAQVHAAASEFRSWALDHPFEFAFAFVNIPTGSVVAGRNQHVVETFERLYRAASPPGPEAAEAFLLAWGCLLGLLLLEVRGMRSGGPRDARQADGRFAQAQAGLVGDGS